MVNDTFEPITKGLIIRAGMHYLLFFSISEWQNVYEMAKQQVKVTIQV